MLLTISNLFPRPDQPQRGLFNAQLFREFAGLLQGRGSRVEGRGEEQTMSPQHLLNLCLVPEWRVWRWRRIRQWTLDPRPWTTDCKATDQADGHCEAKDPGSMVYGLRSTVHGPRSTVHGPRSAVGGVPTTYVPVFYLPRFGRDWTADTYYRGLRNSRVTVRGTRAVFAAWLYPDGVAAARIARDLGVPCWVMVLGSDTFHMQHPRRLRALLGALDDIQGFVCVARSLADTLADAGVDRSKLHVVPNGVDGELFQYRTKAEAWGELTVDGGRWTVEAGGGWTVEGGGEQAADCRPQTADNQQPTPDAESPRRSAPPTLGSYPASIARLMADVVAGRRKLVLFVGNLVPVKGPDVFLKSLAVLKSTVSGPWSIVSVFLGVGPMRRDLEAAARRWGLGDTVHFLGSRPHAEVARWMNLADMLCLTSRGEGMPNVVVEALVSGLPVAVTDVGAARELVENEPLARWCLSEDTRALARAMGDLLSMPADRRAMAARHKDRFSWARQAGSILELMGMSGGKPVNSER